MYKLILLVFKNGLKFLSCPNYVCLSTVNNLDGKTEDFGQTVDGCIGKPRIIWDIRDTRWNVKVPSRGEQNLIDISDGWLKAWKHLVFLPILSKSVHDGDGLNASQLGQGQAAALWSLAKRTLDAAKR